MVGTDAASVVTLGAVVSSLPGFVVGTIVTFAGNVTSPHWYSWQHCLGSFGSGVQSGSGGWQTRSAQMTSPSRQLQYKHGLSSGMWSLFLYDLPFETQSGYSVVDSVASVAGDVAGVVTSDVFMKTVVGSLLSALAIAVVTSGLTVVGTEVTSFVSAVPAEVVVSLVVVDTGVVFKVDSLAPLGVVTSGSMVDGSLTGRFLPSVSSVGCAVPVVASFVSSVTAAVVTSEVTSVKPVVVSFVAVAASVVTSDTVADTLVVTSFVSGVPPGDVPSGVVVGNAAVVSADGTVVGAGVNSVVLSVPSVLLGVVNSGSVGDGVDAPVVPSVSNSVVI